MPPRRPRRPRNEFGDEIPDPRKPSIGKRLSPDQQLDAEVERRNRWRTSAEGKLSRWQVAQQLAEERAQRAKDRRQAAITNDNAMPGSFHSWPQTYDSAMSTADALGMNDQEKRTFLSEIQHNFLSGYTPGLTPYNRRAMERRIRYQYGYGYEFDWPAWRADYAMYGAR